MRRLGVIVSTICVLVACGSKQESPEVSEQSAAAKPAPWVPEGTRFEGTVGQLEDGAAFVEFISDHEQQAVTLDVGFPAAGFEGGQDSRWDFFVIWDDCDNLPEGERPSAAHCTGFEFMVPKVAGAGGGLVHTPGGWWLRGRFVPGAATGPLRGKMAIRLTPAAADSE